MYKKCDVYYSSYWCMETAGLEPASRDIGTQASTSLVSVFVIRQLFGPLTGFRVASLISLFWSPQTVDFSVARFVWDPSICYTGASRKDPVELLTQLQRNCFVCQLLLTEWRFTSRRLDLQLKLDLSLSNPKRPRKKGNILWWMFCLTISIIAYFHGNEKMLLTKGSLLEVLLHRTLNIAFRRFLFQIFSFIVLFLTFTETDQ